MPMWPCFVLLREGRPEARHADGPEQMPHGEHVAVLEVVWVVGGVDPVNLYLSPEPCLMVT